MAVRLSAWLEDTFAWQLVLGNHWLQERHEKKKTGVRAESDWAWDGLYHDNGSSLDITSYTYSQHSSALQVLETEPWTLTDGRNHIVAHLTPDCARDFAARYPAASYLSPGTTIAVRKYTIRYTSYGPPRQRLRFVLHHIDWLGAAGQRACHLNSVDLASIYHQGAIGPVQEQLRETRAREDRRCLSLGEPQVDDTMAHVVEESHNAPGSSNSAASQTLHTQAPFGTQFQNSIPNDATPDELQITGVNRLEPVLAGNTKRVEIVPGAANTDYEKKQHLLTLLGPNQKQRPADANKPRPQGFVQGAFARRNSADQAAAEPSVDLAIEPSDHDAHRFEKQHDNTANTPSLPEHREQSSKEGSFRQSRDTQAADPARATEDTRTHPVVEPDTAADLECSWMKGFIFNSETLKVSNLQQQCLRKDTSWLKPQPGYPSFQNGNMPQSILTSLHRMADEHISAEDDGQSDGGSDMDPSPDRLPPSINLSAESVPQTTQSNNAIDLEDSSSGVVSWENSPEPPQRPAKPDQDLPPDSSPAIPLSSAEQPSRILSKSSVAQSRHVETIEIFDEKPAQPASWPSAVENIVGSDDDMEMEECIPQALGEDLTQKAGPCTDMLAVSSRKLTRPQSFGQVKETPNKKGQTAQHVDDISKQAQNSSIESKDTSSTSVVYSTYKITGAVSSGEAAPGHMHKTDPTLKGHSRASHDKADPPGEVAKARADYISEDVRMLDRPLGTEETAGASGIEDRPHVLNSPPVEATSTSKAKTTMEPRKLHEIDTESPLKSPQAASGATKRKPHGSPAKGNRRHSKRREIKIVGFGDSTPAAVDPIAKLREEREESLRRFREQRYSSTSFEGTPQPRRARMEKSDMDAMDLDSADIPDNEPQSVKRSPRHQSLYDDPSPRPMRLTAPAQSWLTRKEPQSGDQLEPERARHHSTQNLHSRSPSVLSHGERHMTVFESFKAAYPEYKGDTKHFHNQCKQIYILDLEDKMVPKWQWDDFIIRNRTDYRDYAMECLDRGENAEPYHRFYKDTIRDTLYRRGIIQGRKTLEEALEEVGIALEDLDPLPDPPRTQPLSRKSLPGSFAPAKKSRTTHVAASHTRPRQSLPSSSHAHHQTPPSSTSKRPRPRPPVRDTAPEAKEPTGDPYRDYFFAVQRTTSWTGSNKG